MTTKDICAFAAANWSDKVQPVKELSKNDNGHPLVDSSYSMFNFDKIAEALFSSEKQRGKPASVDAIDIYKNTISLIEFKRGFHRNITKENYDEEKAYCTKINPPSICDDYWRLYWKLDETIARELRASILMKALESYIALEKRVMPRCTELSKGKYKIHLIVVIDADASSAEEDLLAGLAKKTPTGKNAYSELRKALSRLQSLKDAEGNSYYYDNIDVVSRQEFLQLLSHR